MFHTAFRIADIFFFSFSFSFHASFHWYFFSHAILFSISPRHFHVVIESFIFHFLLLTANIFLRYATAVGAPPAFSISPASRRQPPPLPPLPALPPAGRRGCQFQAFAAAEVPEGWYAGRRQREWQPAKLFSPPAAGYGLFCAQRCRRIEPKAHAASQRLWIGLRLLLKLRFRRHIVFAMFSRLSYWWRWTYLFAFFTPFCFTLAGSHLDLPRHWYDAIFLLIYYLYFFVITYFHLYLSFIIS